MTIVLCAKGYPGKYIKHKKIKMIDQLAPSKNFIYHAGTKILNGEIISNGGRVLNITTVGNNFLKIRNDILKIIKKSIGNLEFTEKILAGEL